MRCAAGAIGCSRHRCVVARATAQDNAVSLASSSNSSGSGRRQLLAASATALLLRPLLQPLPAAADEEAADGALVVAADVVVGPAEVVAAEPVLPEQPAGPSTTTDVATEEGAIRLRTYDQATRDMTPSDKKVFTLNRRVQAQNRVPEDYPAFIREGFDITVVGEGYTMDPNGLIYRDFVVGAGPNPVDGQQVVFDYTGYNESGAVIDSSYRKGRPAEVRLGINGLIPGFEMGIKGMKPGGKRRIVVPPALGPPVGPSTFFSAKQCEVFDVELRRVLSCERRQMLMFSDVVCE